MIYCTVSYVFKLFRGRISQPNFTVELMVINGHVHPSFCRAAGEKWSGSWPARSHGHLVWRDLDVMWCFCSASRLYHLVGGCRPSQPLASTTSLSALALATSSPCCNCGGIDALLLLQPPQVSSWLKFFVLYGFGKNSISIG
jgi:hypothetical protein